MNLHWLYWFVAVVILLFSLVLVASTLYFDFPFLVLILFPVAIAVVALACFFVFKKELALVVARGAQPSSDVEKLSLRIQELLVKNQALHKHLTQLKLTGEDLQESRREQRDLLNKTPSAIHIKDLDGRYVFINKKFETQFRTANHKMRGKTDHDFYPRATADKIRANDLAVINGDAPMEFEEIVPHKDKVFTYVSIKFQLKRLSGEVYATCGISTDITRRKLAEEALRHSQKMDAVGQMAGGIAHDFNNILGIIIGNLDDLKERVRDDEKSSERVDSIYKSALRAADLTKHLLSFSGQQVDHPVVVDVNNVIEGLGNLVAHSIAPEIEIELVLDNKLWLTNIDVGDLEGALVNMVLNARDAMHAGGQVKIITSNTSLDEKFCAGNPGAKPGKYVLIRITDNGAGIPLASLSRIFDPFFTTKPQGKGTGLGLAMVFGFIRRSNGYITVESKVDQGSSFFLYLPRAQEQWVQASVILPAFKSSTKGSESILIVDDEVGLITLVQESLQVLGYKVFVANNGHEAIEQLGRNPSIALLFTDILMPGGLNGYELARQAQESWPDIKVLLTSGYVGEAGLEQTQSGLALSFLDKPYSQSELAQRIRSILDEPQPSNVVETT